MTKYVECQTNDLEKILMNLQKLFLVSYATFHFIYIYTYNDCKIGVFMAIIFKLHNYGRRNK